MFVVISTLIWAVLTGPTDWVCHIGTLNTVCRGSCLQLYYCNMVECFWSRRPTGFLQCLDTVALVVWPVKLVSEMTYTVLSGTLILYITLPLVHFLLAGFCLVPIAGHPGWVTVYHELYVCMTFCDSSSKRGTCFCDRWITKIIVNHLMTFCFYLNVTTLRSGLCCRNSVCLSSVWLSVCCL